jgi:FtsK/SpoIIIE family
MSDMVPHGDGADLDAFQAEYVFEGDEGGDAAGRPDLPAGRARRQKARRAATKAVDASRIGAHKAADASRAAGRVSAKASAATGRVAWQFRIELLPLYVFGVLFLAGLVHHRMVAPIDEGDVQSVLLSYGVGVITAAVVVYVALNMPKAKDGSTTASGAFLASGGLLGGVTLLWLTALVLLGPSPGLVISGFVISMLSGIPYWMHVYGARHPQQVMLNLPGSMVPPPEETDPLDKVIKGASWEGMQQIDSGFERMLRLPDGADPVRIVKGYGPKFATLLKVGVDNVEILDVRDDAGHLRVRTYNRDLLELPASPDFVKCQTWDFLEGVPVGRDRAGEDVILNMTESHLLIGGQPGSGKSGAMALVMSAAALDPRVRLFLLDGKKTELVIWQKRAERYADDDLSRARALLVDLREEMGRIADKQVERGVRKFDPEVDDLIVLGIDELPRYTANTELRARILDILQVIRSLGGMVVATAQRPSGQQVTADLRAQFTHRWCMRVADSQTARMILGEGWPVKPHQIPKGKPGYGFLTSEDGAPRGARADWMDEEQIHAVAKRAARLKPTHVVPGKPAAELVPGDIVAFPNGHPIKNDDEKALWLALPILPEDHRKIAGITGDVDMSPNTIRDKLRKWATQGWVEELGKAAENGTTGPLRYARHPVVQAELVGNGEPHEAELVENPDDGDDVDDERGAA